MNHITGYNLGRYYLIFRQIYPSIITIICAISIYFNLTAERKVIKPAVVAVTENGIVSLSCSNSDLEHKKIAYQTSKKIAELIFNYSKGQTKVYAEKHILNRSLAIENSPAARKIYNYAFNILGSGNNGGPIEKESSKVDLEKDSFVSRSQNNKYYVMVKAKQTVQTENGNSYKYYNLKITLVDGGENEVFKVNDLDIDILSGKPEEPVS